MNYYFIYEFNSCVPFYNEEKFIKESVSKLVSVNVAQYIYLVDDFSTDNSPAIAKELAEQFDNVKLFSKNVNERKGSCLRFIQSEIITTHVVMHDADLEQNPFDLLKISDAAKVNRNSLIIGSRTLGQGNRVRMYKYLSFANQILSNLFNLLHFTKVSDISSGYIMYSMDFLNSIDIKERGFGIEVELLSKFIKSNKNIIEIPIDYLEERTQKEKKLC